MSGARRPVAGKDPNPQKTKKPGVGKAVRKAKHRLERLVEGGAAGRRIRRAVNALAKRETAAYNRKPRLEGQPAAPAAPAAPAGHVHGEHCSHGH